MKRSSNSRGRKRRADSPLEPGAKKSKQNDSEPARYSAYNGKFQQYMVNNGIYYPNSMHPNGEKPAKPANWQELNDRLTKRRASLSPTRFTDEDFEKFKENEEATSSIESMLSVIVILQGNVPNARTQCSDYVFNNLMPLLDKITFDPRPDLVVGSRPETLKREIRDILGEYIIPSTNDSLPLVPNFFLEMKATKGSLAVATRQACYSGTLGARGLHKLQHYRCQQPTYDNKAYTITSTYHRATLRLHTIHPIAPRDGDVEERPRYVMSLLGTFVMTEGPESYRSGVSAYRNAVDWAKEQRDEAIRVANERFRTQPEPITTVPVRETNSKPAMISRGTQTPAHYP